MKTLKGRVISMNVQPMAGDNIDELKKVVAATALAFECKIYFSHNNKKFICDKEGNIAQLN